MNWNVHNFVFLNNLSGIACQDISECQKRICESSGQYDYKNAALGDWQCCNINRIQYYPMIFRLRRCFLLPWNCPIKAHSKQTQEFTSFGPRFPKSTHHDPSEAITLHPFCVDIPNFALCSAHFASPPPFRECSITYSQENGMEHESCMNSRLPNCNKVRYVLFTCTKDLGRE